MFLPGSDVLSILDAVFIVSPKMENLGSLVPIRPLTTGPVCMPTRTTVGSLLCGMMTVLAQRRRACSHEETHGAKCDVCDDCDQ